MKNTAPYVAAINLTGGEGQPTRAELLHKFETIPLRYSFRLDHEYPERSIIKVSAYSPEARGWNELWTIDGASYELGSGYNVDARVALVQELANELFIYASRIL